MSSNTKFSPTLVVSSAFVAVLALGLGYGIFWCWQNRQTPETRMAACEAAVEAFREAKDGDICNLLKKMSEPHVHTMFNSAPPYMHIIWEPLVPSDRVAQLTVDSLKRFGGNGEPEPGNVPRIVELMAFADAFLASCAPEAPATYELRDQLLNSHFSIGDYKGVVALHEKGLVPSDHVAKFADERFQRFAGDSRAKSREDPRKTNPRLNELIAFIEGFLPTCKREKRANKLCDRLLDLHFRFDDGEYSDVMALHDKGIVPSDRVARFAEEYFLRSAGNGEPNSEDVPKLKRLIAFSERFLPKCSNEDAANALRDRLLDGHFLIGDYDGAIAMLENGLPGHDPGWCKSTVAKLRAHRALEKAATPGLDAESVKKAKLEAVDNFTAFGEYMLSPAMQKFEDCDPTTGVIYSFEWVAAKNFMRSSVLAREAGEAKKADELAARARKYYAPALEKAKEDKKSLEVLKAEMKSYGL